MKQHYLALAISSAMLLSACGGGSDSDNDTNDDLLNFDNIASETDYMQGQNPDLLLFAPGDEITDIQWSQTSGPAVTLLADKSKAISFEAENAGQYTFSVSYKSNGTSVNESATISVSEASPKLRLSRGHSVVETGNVSLRLFADSDIEMDTISWRQLSGPTISFDENNIDPLLAIFTAPVVNQDQIIEIEVTAETRDGDVYRDKASILVEDRPSIAGGAYFDDGQLANVYVYNQDSPYKDTLVECVYSNQLDNSCRLGDLPLLATDSNGATPTIDQIMDRVVVSHDWMAVNFRAFLEAYDDNDDFKNLLRATTGIVLSYDIRPSFYWAATGAIYLDPENLWLSAAQRETINEAPDYRSDFGNDLQFVIPWRYVKDNDYVSLYYPPEDGLSRDLSDMRFELTDLLYHELAHANDYMPPAEWDSYGDSTRFLNAAVEEDEISDDLDRLYPLLSDDMRDLAEVRFLTGDSNATQRSYMPDDVVGFYRPDRSNGFYNYTNEKEDLAILFEELMMSVRFGIQRDTAVTSVPVYDNSGDLIRSQSYIVSWGQRGRVAEDSVSARAEYITERLLPEVDLSLIDSLPEPLEMNAGQNWWDNLGISPQPPTPLKSMAGSKLPISGALQPKMSSYRQGHIKALPTRK
ncbi:hypothetical protein [Thalassotalea sp. Y01]|uniref:hypothetical protein n=1 Tax=Thalassotalea sp. Y01 TaxID=2729613 RepID=UPI00145DCBF6|nr:hypothetical protein [Thalassotalea sp. Y01]NMP16726.1 hypothetical protein [Thalassotalea sp. Y01]